MRHLVPQEFKELEGEGFVLGFGFLQGEHIDLGFIEPVLDAVGAGANGVHVPGSNLHVLQLTVRALPGNGVDATGKDAIVERHYSSGLYVQPKPEHWFAPLLFLLQGFSDAIVGVLA